MQYFDLSNLLKTKTITPLAKLFLIYLQDKVQYSYNLNATAAEIAKEMGTTRKNILVVLDDLQKLDIISSDVIAPTRITKFKSAQLL